MLSMDFWFDYLFMLIEGEELELGLVIDGR